MYSRIRSSSMLASCLRCYKPQVLITSKAARCVGTASARRQIADQAIPKETAPTFENKLMGGPEFSGKPLTKIRFSPAAFKLGDDIRSGLVDPAVHLRRQLDQGDTDVETVNICLWGYRTFRLAGMDPEQRANSLAADQLGSLSLAWLWKDEKRWATVLERNFMFIPTLCYFVAAEQKHEYLLETLRLNMLSDKTLPFGVEKSSRM